MIKRLMWPGILFVLIGSVVAVDAVMLFVSLNDESFAVAEGYAGRGGMPSNSIDQTRENRRLGWTVETDVRWVDADTVEIQLRVVDADGRALGQPAATLQVFHKARASEVIDVPLVMGDDGAFGGRLKVSRLGHWGLRATVVQGADVFTASIDRVIDASTEGSEP